jgi:hypothetical protein
MLNSFFKGVFLFATVFIPIVFLATGSASGQIQEPRLEGVSYSQMAEWQFNYGGGPFFRGGYGPGYCEPPPNIVDNCPVDEPPVGKKQKRKSRESTK